MSTADTGMSVVNIVDDDESVLQALSNLVRSVGLKVNAFSSPEEFLAHDHTRSPSCLVLDIRLPGLNGFELHQEMQQAGLDLPTVFITGHGDVPMAVKAMKAGSVDFLEKPFRDQDVLDAIHEALKRDVERHAEAERHRAFRGRYDTLTPREKEVMALVAAGLMNKQIAEELSITEVTVKVHRRNLIGKLGARSVADLVRISDALGIDLPAVQLSEVAGAEVDEGEYGSSS